MNSRDTLKNYNLNGFVVLKKIFSKNEINKILLELEIIKKLLKKTKDKKFFHKTKDGKINKKKLSLVIKHILGDSFKVRNIEFFLKPKKLGWLARFIKIISIGILLKLRLLMFGLHAHLAQN